MAKLYCECFNVSDSPDNLKCKLLYLIIFYK